MTHPVPEWAGTAVAWVSEVAGLDPVGTVPGAGSWSTPFSDFAPLSDPIAMELRAESISQLIHGDALRCGEAECIESTGSGTGADIVAGRDRVRVHGRLREHTGRELAAMVAHLDTSVGGSLEVHAGHDDTVLLAGHMRESWHGGTAVVAAVADDLAAGGGVRVTMPLDLWVHGLMGVEERAGTCAADVVVVELAGTHYEREYNGGVHMARLARFAGAMHVTAKTGFFPLMEVSCGVRNLIAGSGEGSGEPASPTPPPAEGAGTAAAAATLARDTGRTTEGAADVGVRGQDAADLRHASALPESDAGEDLCTLYQVSPDIGELLASGNGLEDIAGSTDELGELNHSTDAAEQLASLQSGESVGSGGAMTAGQQQALDELLSAIDMRVAETLDEPATTSSRTDDAVEAGWSENFATLQEYHHHHTECGNASAAQEYRRAVGHIVDEVLAAYSRFGATGDELSADHATDADRAQEAYSDLHRMLFDAQQLGDHARADEIRQALDRIDELTSQHILDLIDIDRGSVAWVSETSSSSSSWSIPWYASIRPDSSTPSLSSGPDGPAPSIPIVHVDDSNGTPVTTHVHAADSEGRVLIGADEYEAFRRGDVVLEVVDANGDEMALGDYTILVHGYTIGPDGDLYATVRPHGHGQVQADELGEISPPGTDSDGDASPPTSRIEDPDEIAEPNVQPLERPESPLDGLYERPPGPEYGSSAVPLRPDDGPGRVGFGRERLSESSSPGWQAESSPGFGRAQALEQASFPYSYREDVIQDLMRDRGLSALDVDILDVGLERAICTARVTRHSEEWRSMADLISSLRTQTSAGGHARAMYGGSSNFDWRTLDALLRLLDRPRPGRPPRRLS